MIPIVELLEKNPDRNPIMIDTLILAPARELACQIAAEAKELLTFNTSKKVVCMYGGTNINTDKRNLNGKVHILVATPGMFYTVFPLHWLVLTTVKLIFFEIFNNFYLMIIYGILV